MNESIDSKGSFAAQMHKPTNQPKKLTKTVQEVVELGGSQQGAHLLGIVPVQKVVQVVQLIACSRGARIRSGVEWKEKKEIKNGIN